MKGWSTFLVCLLLSFGLWLVLSLSRMNSDVETVPVVALCNLEGCSERSVEAVDVAARCKASGFTLLYLSIFDRPVEVRFDPDDMVPVGDGVYELRSTSLYRYVKDIFPPGTTVESFIGSSLKFRFAPEACVKLPVLPQGYLECRPQYMTVGEMTVSPDSVLVYGDPSLTASLDGVRTRPVRASDLHSDAHGLVRLVLPSGLRCSEEVVTYSVAVRRYVELSRRVELHFRNVPEGVRLGSLSRDVSVRLRCEFPLRQNPFDVIDFYVDYEDFDRSRGGQCPLRSGNVPGAVLDWSAEPGVVSCFVIL